MPTFQVTRRSERDRKQFAPDSRARFQRVVTGQFAPGLARSVFRAGSRINGAQAAPDMSEMTWAQDGRATFSHRPEQQAGEPHLIWRRLGTHDIYREP